MGVVPQEPPGGVERQPPWAAGRSPRPQRPVGGRDRV